MRFKLDFHEVDFAQSRSMPGKVAWASLQERKAKTAYCTFGSHVHMLPGQNMFLSQMPEIGQTSVDDQLLHLHCNVANFLVAERTHHDDGQTPFEDELALLAMVGKGGKDQEAKGKAKGKGKGGTDEEYVVMLEEIDKGGKGGMGDLTGEEENSSIFQCQHWRANG